MFQVASSLCPHHAHKSFYFALLWHSYSLQFFNCKSTLCYTEAKFATQIARHTIVFHFLLPIFFFFSSRWTLLTLCLIIFIMFTSWWLVLLLTVDFLLWRARVRHLSRYQGSPQYPIIHKQPVIIWPLCSLRRLMWYFIFQTCFFLLFVLLVMKEKGMFANSWLNVYIFFQFDWNSKSNYIDIRMIKLCGFGEFW